MSENRRKNVQKSMKIVQKNDEKKGTKKTRENESAQVLFSQESRRNLVPKEKEAKRKA